MGKRKDEAPEVMPPESQAPEPGPGDFKVPEDKIVLCAPVGVESVGHSGGVLEVVDGRALLDRAADRELIQTLIRSCGFTEAGQ